MSAALQRVLDDTRQRFVDTFADQCASIRILIDKVDALGTNGPVAALTQAAHRLSGLAGTIGSSAAASCHFSSLAAPCLACCSPSWSSPAPGPRVRLPAA